MNYFADNKELVNELIRYSRLCYERKLAGASGGNLSVRLPQQDAFVVTASGVSLRDVSVENLLIVDSQGTILEGCADLQPSKEVRFHLVIYRARPDVSAVIHVHPPNATIFACLGQDIPLATVSASLKLKQGNVISEAHPGSQELSDFVREAVESLPRETTLLLLKRHGIVTFCATLCEAFDNAELAEDTAKIALGITQFKEIPSGTDL